MRVDCICEYFQGSCAHFAHTAEWLVTNGVSVDIGVIIQLSYQILAIDNQIFNEYH